MVRTVGGKIWGVAKRLEDAARDPTARVVAASAAVAAGGAITGAAVRRRIANRRRREGRSYRLRPDEPATDGVRRVAVGQLMLATELVRGDHGDDRGEAVHDARKALKRLRALIRLSRDAIGPERYRAENVTFRDVGRSLSGARDAEVVLQTLDDLATRFAAEVPAGAWSRFRHVLEAERDATAAPQNGAAARESVTALSNAARRVAAWRLQEDRGLEALAPGFERIYRRGRRALRVTERDPTAENLHELRKRAKDLWHAGQVLDTLRPTTLKRLRRRAHRLSDLLGADHDLAVLWERARSSPELFAEGELELLSAVVKRRRRTLRRKALRCAERVYRRKPRRLVNKLFA